jgi:hypothetical protein
LVYASWPSTHANSKFQSHRIPLAKYKNQDLNSNDRKYAYVVWKLSSDGKQLTLRSVNKVIPKETKDSAAVAALLTKNARNPELFGEEIEFRKEK